MDAIADEETPDINFTADDSETPDIDFAGNTEQHEVDIDDLDEPDQYVEPADEENELDDDTGKGVILVELIGQQFDTPSNDI